MNFKQLKKWLTKASPAGILGALSLHMLYNKIVFGVSSPASGQIKRWWEHWAKQFTPSA
jgi:hypothetical protein